MPAAAPPRRRALSTAFQWLLAALSAAVLALAAGAVWMVPVMLARHGLPWLALPAGLLLGVAMRRWIHPAGVAAAVLAAAATLVATLYVGALTAAAKIAGLMGLGLLEAMRQAGPGMLLELGRHALSPGDAAWLGAGMLAAALAAARRPRRARG
ncbi:vitamin B12 transport system permease protein [Fulvimonas soli]|uniref:Vitamin B12 transport system permease protein n=1 Tax=Fulvimonas soli TaxID=155197 RepID=A0A316I386_9GAMM|nr:hypothetical protein [Fulvimonas soli]PWK87526.1 vitamin B12 transport system permease protein [Fulvimonas soli]